jgi:hypothetical protein
MNIYVYMEGDATTVIAFKEVGAAHYNAVKRVFSHHGKKAIPSSINIDNIYSNC